LGLKRAVVTGLPCSSFATTVREAMVRRVLPTAIDAFTPSGTGLNSRVSACLRSASKSWPAIANSFFAASSVIQPSMFALLMFLSGATRSNFSFRFPCTTENG